jgi:glycosyltransferase involved in cell wall biosynthesis
LNGYLIERDLDIVVLHRKLPKSKLFLPFWAFWYVLITLFKPCDVIMAHWLVPSGLVGSLVSFIRRKKLVLVAHGTDVQILKRSKVLGWLADWMFERAYRVVTVSQYLLGELLSFSRLSIHERTCGEADNTPKFEVIPMPVHRDFWEKTIPVKREPNFILFAGRPTEQKGIDTLLYALSRLLEWEHWLALEDFDVPKVQELYRQATVCVLPAFNEGFGLTLVEAKLCGAPVIGARSGGIPEIIEDGKTGLLIEPGDSEGLAQAIKKILTNKKLAARLGKAGQKSARQKFDPHKIADRYAEILDETFSNRGKQ